MTDKAPVKITAQHKVHPNLRKLARALIALAQKAEAEKRSENRAGL